MNNKVLQTANIIAKIIVSKFLLYTAQWNQTFFQ